MSIVHFLHRSGRRRVHDPTTWNGSGRGVLLEITEESVRTEAGTVKLA